MLSKSSQFVEMLLADTKSSLEDVQTSKDYIELLDAQGAVFLPLELSLLAFVFKRNITVYYLSEGKGPNGFFKDIELFYDEAKNESDRMTPVKILLRH